MGKKEKNVGIQCMSTGDLPEGWVISTLGEISTKPQYGWTTKANHESGEVKLLRTTDITSGKIDWITVPYCTKEPDDLKKYLLKAGDIVISRAGSVGVSYLLTDTDNAVFASYLIRFRPNEPVDKKYVYYYLKSPDYWKAIGKSTLGIAVPNVNATKLAKIKIPIAPENEQKRIVAEIEKQFSRLDEAVDNLKRVKTDLKRYKASVLKAAVEGKLTEEWRKKHPDVEPADKLLQRILAERRKKWEEVELAKMKAKGKKPKDDKWKKKYKEPAKPELDGLPSLPDGWVWATVIQLSFVVSGQTPKGIANEPISGDIPWFKVGDMNTNGNERLMNKAVMYLTEKRAKKLGLNIQPAGTIIFPKRGGAIATNKKRILSNPSGYDLNTMGVYPIVVHHTYFWQWFLSINLGSLGDGSNVPQINHGDIEPLHVPLPPFVEQIQISEVVERSMSLADGLLSIVDVNLKRADRLRQSILKKAFWGELVSQDMNDEPAITLMKKTG